MSKRILGVENLTISFGGIKAVNHLSFSVNEGEIYGLIGPNGAGKTTVFNCITQFYKPDKGEVCFVARDGKTVNLVDLKPHMVIAKGLVRTFQNIELIGEMNVIDNLLVGAHTIFQSGFFAHGFRLKSARQEERTLRKKAMIITDFLGLTDRAHARVSGLPYGVLKKVELGRTLMSDPKLIILDEPAAGLNDLETVDMAKLLRKVRDDYQCTILLVEHDMRLVMDVCDRICAISFGEKLSEGTPAEIQQNKDVQEAYLGKEDDVDERPDN